MALPSVGCGAALAAEDAAAAPLADDVAAAAVVVVVVAMVVAVAGRAELVEVQEVPVDAGVSTAADEAEVATTRISGSTLVAGVGPVCSPCWGAAPPPSSAARGESTDGVCRVCSLLSKASRWAAPLDSGPVLTLQCGCGKSDQLACHHFFSYHHDKPTLMCAPQLGLVVDGP